MHGRVRVPAVCQFGGVRAAMLNMRVWYIVCSVDDACACACWNTADRRCMCQAAGEGCRRRGSVRNTLLHSQQHSVAPLTVRQRTPLNVTFTHPFTVYTNDVSAAPVSLSSARVHWRCVALSHMCIVLTVLRCYVCYVSLRLCMFIAASSTLLPLQLIVPHVSVCTVRRDLTVSENNRR